MLLKPVIQLPSDLFQLPEFQQLAQLTTKTQYRTALALWLKLLLKAGRLNQAGLVYTRAEWPLSLGAVCRLANITEIPTARRSLAFLIQAGLLATTENHQYRICNWQRYYLAQPPADYHGLIKFTGKASGKMGQQPPLPPATTALDRPSAPQASAGSSRPNAPKTVSGALDDSGAPADNAAPADNTAPAMQQPVKPVPTATPAATIQQATRSTATVKSATTSQQATSPVAIAKPAVTISPAVTAKPTTASPPPLTAYSAAQQARLQQATVKVLAYLNQQTGKRFVVDQRSQRLLGHLFQQQVTMAQIKQVINWKCHEWRNTEFWKFVRPQTLFGPKFNQYLQEAPPLTRPKTRTTVSRQAYLRQLYGMSCSVAEVVRRAAADNIHTTTKEVEAIAHELRA
ncbi:hypothetical protein FC24_GL000025 [Loigolactobacillus rennini DSM 20253]|uniref:Uncharacterized protein n=1 Tax=Loigolactobacillus rennini DSM 20253 TaxID=1423796 RepID=A0A0R2DEL3_9LACO|nr:hypothetical protein FC24_GL000025 [Loigolactobacillus rennini DSM 20253]